MNERLKPFEEKMKKTIGNLDGELSAIRAGRANPNVLNKIMVDYYGTPTPTPAGSKRIRTGSTYDSDPAMGKENGKRD